MVTNDPETMHSKIKKITSHEKHHIYTDDDGVEKKKNVLDFVNLPPPTYWPLLALCSFVDLDLCAIILVSSLWLQGDKRSFKIFFSVKNYSVLSCTHLHMYKIIFKFL